jgi:sugar phosphate isomerase/epimerase
LHRIRSPGDVRRGNLTLTDRVVGRLQPRVENLMDSFFEFDSLPGLFEETDALGCLDTGHAHVTGADTAAQAALLREHGDRIPHVHLNDTRYDHDDEHLPVGLGKLDFEPVAHAMRETDWTGTCTHEVYSFGTEYVDHGKTAFDRLLDGDAGSGSV